MMRTDNSEAWRNSKIERIRNEQARRVEKLRELNRQIGELEDMELVLAGKLQRALNFDANRWHCPRCAIDNGKMVELSAIPTGTVVIDDQPEDVDLMQCPVCGWDDTITS